MPQCRIPEQSALEVCAAEVAGREVAAQQLRALLGVHQRNAAAYVSIRQKGALHSSRALGTHQTSLHSSRIRQHASAYVTAFFARSGHAPDKSQFSRLSLLRCASVSIRQHTSACVSIRQRTAACAPDKSQISRLSPLRSASVRMMSAYVNIRQHTSAYVSIRQQVANVSRSQCSVPDKSQLRLLVYAALSY